MAQSTSKWISIISGVMLLLLAILLVLVAVPIVECECVSDPEISQIRQMREWVTGGKSFPSFGRVLCKVCRDALKVPLLRFSSGSQDPDTAK